jgi:hypothetical protein
MLDTTVFPQPYGPMQIADAQSAGDHVIVTNTGTVTVYIGGQYATATTGLPVYPGMEIDISVATAALYAITDPGTLESVTAVTSGVVASHAVSIPLAVDGDSFAAGMYVLLEDGPASEVLSVASVASDTQLDIAAPYTQYAHASGITVIEISPVRGQLHVIAGTS